MLKNATDMTEGSIWRLLTAFAVPLLLGNLIQQMYNLADSVILGNFVGKEALAAVGSTTYICNTMVNFFNGVSIGAGVVISRRFGAHDLERLHEAVETTMAITFLTGAAFTMIAIPAMPWMLRLMSTPADVFDTAKVYLRIYFAGISALLVYNMGSAILRAVGDTRNPLLFLIVSNVLNIVLDIVFVIALPWKIAGAAAATILSEFLSAILVLFVLSHTEQSYRFSWTELKIVPSTVKEILSIGLPTGIQQTLTSMSNVVVQSYINAFGSATMAGWSCFNKIDQFAMLPMQSMAQATTTFVGQNLGAKKPDRAKSGTRTALLMTIGVIGCILICMWVSAKYLVLLFIQDDDVVRYGIMFVRYVAPFKIFSCVNQICAGALRGAGDSRGPMLILLFSLVFWRQLYLRVITRFTPALYPVGFAYPVGWMMCATLTFLYYLYKTRSHKIFEKE